MKNTQYNSSDVKIKCENKLGIGFRPGKELVGWFRHDGKKKARITVPKGKKPLRIGTYKSMASQLELSVEQFDELLDCPLKLKGYLEILMKKGIIS